MNQWKVLAVRVHSRRLPDYGPSSRNLNFWMARQPSKIAFNREEIGGSRALPVAPRSHAKGPKLSAMLC